MPAFEFNANDLQRLNRLMFLRRGAATEESAGGHRTRRSGEGTEFLDFRAYAPGDDFRNVDWTLYGRLRQLVIRLHESPQQLSVTLLIDASRSMGFGSPSTKLVMAQQIACALGFIALRGGDRLYASSFAASAGEYLGPLTGRRGLAALVRFLTRLAPAGAGDLEAGVSRLQARGRRRGLVIVLSDFLNAADPEDALARVVAAGGKVLAVQVLDKLDRGVGLATGTARLRDSESGKRVDVRLDAAAVARYQRAFEARRARLEAFCARRGQNYLLADTGDNYLQLVCDVLRSRAVLR